MTGREMEGERRGRGAVVRMIMVVMREGKVRGTERKESRSLENNSDMSNDREGKVRCKERRKSIRLDNNRNNNNKVN